MKKVYEKPVVEIECYTLSASIAANCDVVVNLGPGSFDKNPCTDYPRDEWEVMTLNPGMSIMSAGNTPFYEDGDGGCNCYYSSGGEGLFTS